MTERREVMSQTRKSPLRYKPLAHSFPGVSFRGLNVQRHKAEVVSGMVDISDAHQFAGTGAQGGLCTQRTCPLSRRSLCLNAIN
jgi:hypothetical protein